MNTFEVQKLLGKIEQLLRSNGCASWADRVRVVKLVLVEDPVAGKSEVLSMFGGLGSLSDIILYSNGTPLIAENDILQELRQELFEQLH
ncbi:DUF6966 domain-containing protein [Pseudoduganella lurida]|uniref:DUF6966 domain-containing protein n=1 Tax=Pseudoduganella lurida TaxID=1036180 RepID=UPI00119DAB0A|nr:hypothetical protein [Pseudoduganella lurida]